MNNKLFVFVLILAGFLGISAVNNNNSKDCVNVYVDFGSLDHNKKVIGCVDADHKVNALTVLEHSGINIEGTDKYGLQVVCRVNSLPKPSVEPCKTMPPENAYWAVITKQNISALSMQKHWNWAQTGISDVYLEPGDSLGLVFTENEKMKWPD